MILDWVEKCLPFPYRSYDAGIGAIGLTKSVRLGIFGEMIVATHRVEMKE